MPWWERFFPWLRRHVNSTWLWRVGIFGLFLTFCHYRQRLTRRLTPRDHDTTGPETEFEPTAESQVETAATDAEERSIEPPAPAPAPAAPAIPAPVAAVAPEAPVPPAAPAVPTPAPVSAVAAAPRPKVKESGLARGFFNKAPKKAKKDTANDEPVKAVSVPVEKDPATAREAVLRQQEAGVRLFHSCAFREAKTIFEKMLQMASEAKLGKEEGQAYRLLANCLDKLNAPEEEIGAAYKQAMRLAYQHDDMHLSFNVLTGMGSHEVKMEKLDEAEQLYFQSLMLAKRVLSPHEEAIAEGNLGMCLGQMEGRRAESLEHFRKALKLQDGSNTHSVVTLLANYASALCADDRYEEAQKEYEAALTLARKIGDRRVEVNILTNLANLCEHVLSLPEKAQRYRNALKGHAEGMADVCAICLENLEDGRPQIVLQCNHMYHSECFEGVLSSESEHRSKCPQCRNSHSSFAAA